MTFTCIHGQIASRRLARQPALSRRHSLMLLGLGASALALHPTALLGQTRHLVTAHNRAPDGAQMAFAPAILRISAGQTIRFRHADRGHNVQSYDDMLPDGATAFGAGIGQEFDVTFDIEGSYGYFCRPHQAMGMIGYILVGDFTRNLDAVRAASAALRGPMISRRVEEYLARVTAIGRAEGLI
ncbi:MAG: pseudoazurin [Rhodobacteraceae bacterium]|nr:pseudoazurin [Paracoccaceae bacterium]